MGETQNKNVGQNEDIIEKRFKDGSLLLVLDKDGFIKSARIELTNVIIINASVENGHDNVIITYKHPGGTKEELVYDVAPGSTWFEDPWFINDPLYYTQYLKQDSIRKLVGSVLGYLKDRLEDMVDVALTDVE